MKLDRNKDGNDGHGKYALLLLRNLELCRDPSTFGELTPRIKAAIELLAKNHIIDWGLTESDSEFFVIRLKDKYAQDALYAYAHAAMKDDPEWAAEVSELAARSGPRSKFCKRPD